MNSLNTIILFLLLHSYYINSQKCKPLTTIINEFSCVIGQYFKKDSQTCTKCGISYDAINSQIVNLKGKVIKLFKNIISHYELDYNGLDKSLRDILHNIESSTTDTTILGKIIKSIDDFLKTLQPQFKEVWATLKEIEVILKADKCADNSLIPVIRSLKSQIDKLIKGIADVELDSKILENIDKLRMKLEIIDYFALNLSNLQEDLALETENYLNLEQVKPYDLKTLSQFKENLSKINKSLNQLKNFLIEIMERLLNVLLLDDDVLTLNRKIDEIKVIMYARCLSYFLFIWISTTLSDTKCSQKCVTTSLTCPPERYRSYDGSCNNQHCPRLGMQHTTFARLLPANYADGVQKPALAKSGRSLPSSRNLSLVLYLDRHVEDSKLTLNAMQFGQIIGHDMSKVITDDDSDCCDDGHLPSKIPDNCFPISLLPDDPIAEISNKNCISYKKSSHIIENECLYANSAEQVSAVTHFLDLSLVYGSDEKINKKLRQFQDGKLKVEIKRGSEWLPRERSGRDFCAKFDSLDSRYFTGDSRVDATPQLALLHTVFVREHNRICDILSKMNKNWSDDRIFQEARKINIAQYQCIAYYEWLPKFLGRETLLKTGIIYDTEGFVNDYRKDVDPSVTNEYATVALRFFHSLIPGSILMTPEERKSTFSLRLSDWYNKPTILEHGDNFDYLARGLSTQSSLAPSTYHDNEITQFLFREGQFGKDLKATDIQRSRDHGLAPYRKYRQLCNLPDITSFDDLKGLMRNSDIEKLKQLYESSDDIDLAVGGSLEYLVPGALAGPTFLCILKEQFFRTRVGDKFWFENDGVLGFTNDQLREIRKASISRIMCDNSKNIAKMQPDGFLKITDKNSLKSCEELPRINLDFWKESPMPV